MEELEHKKFLSEQELNRERIAKRQKFDDELEKRKAELENDLSFMKRELEAFEKENLDILSGLYSAQYNFGSAIGYKNELEKIREEQKQLIKNGMAIIRHQDWTVNGSLSEGKKQTNDLVKLVLRAFNGESDVLILKVKYNNIQSIKNKILQLLTSINGLIGRYRLELNKDYLNLKLKEFYLVYEYQSQLQSEREEQRQIQEQIREEQKVLKEIEKLRTEAEKEELIYQKALDKAKEEFNKASLLEREKLKNYIQEVEEKLRLAEEKKERAISQAQLTRRGHVYVISNIGSFGEDIYKIGLTRRLEPMDRIDELNNASVPFPFDVHAIIYSKDAPTLEKKLHQVFAGSSVNKVNNRKEFFEVSLKEIEKAVYDNYGEIEFTKVAEAEQYRKSLSFVS